MYIIYCINHHTYIIIYRSIHFNNIKTENLYNKIYCSNMEFDSVRYIKYEYM
jgi:hypothetical protein